MRKHTHYAATLFLFLAFFNANLPDHVSLYIGSYKDISIQEMKRSGIPASIILAQGIHESAWGKGKLALNSNNHFGIKCKDYWTGPTYYHKDDDYDENGKLLKSCFRAYENSEASYIDHTDFLVNSPRYQNLFNFSQTNYIQWAKGLKKCGYATDPEYAEKLIRTIKKYGLDKYDQQLSTPAVASAPSYTIPPTNTTAQTIVIQKEEIPDIGYATQIYEVPAAMPIPDSYERINFQSLFKEEPVQQQAVQPIPHDYNEVQQEIIEILPEITEEYIPESYEEQVEIEEVPSETQVVYLPPSVHRPVISLNKESIIPIKSSKKQRKVLLGRKPRVNHSGLR